MIDALTVEGWQALEPLLDRLLDLDRAARGAELERIASGDSALAAWLRSLLVEVDTDDSPPATPAASRYGALLAASLAAVPAIVGDTYRLESLIGTGGVGSVYRAWDQRRRRVVAVKLLSRTLTSHVERSRFRAEIEIAGRLTHPHILPVFDSGETDQALFYVVPLLGSGSLRERLTEAGGPLERAKVIRWGRQVADALEYAHGQGIVHRDIKPDNVLIHEGHAIVADFGIARAICPDAAAAARLRTTGHAVGTPAYMSPEQWDIAGPIDGRADIYALGVMLAELLTGVSPSPLGTVGPPNAGPVDRLTAPCREVIERAAAPRADERYPTAGAFAAALASISD
jgi:serine/threonine-protein kinase